MVQKISYTESAVTMRRNVAIAATAPDNPVS
jgi:hypothetical protein